jgi:hypothetical protein
MARHYIPVGTPVDPELETKILYGIHVAYRFIAKAKDDAKKHHDHEGHAEGNAAWHALHEVEVAVMTEHRPGPPVDVSSLDWDGKQRALPSHGLKFGRVVINGRNVFVVRCVCREGIDGTAQSEEDARKFVQAHLQKVDARKRAA